MEKEYRIDPDFQSIMPSLTDEEKKELEESLLKDGFKGAPIIVWHDIIIDGHNRYKLCKKHDIPYEVRELEFDGKEEVIQWMVRAQLGRRNLQPGQKVDLVKKFKPIFEEQARKNRSESGGDRKSKSYKKSVMVNLPQPIPSEQSSKPKRNPTVAKQLADIAGISEKTFRMGEKVLDSDREELKKQMLSGEKTVNASYTELKRLEKQGRVPEHHTQDEPEGESETPKEIKKQGNIEDKLNQIREKNQLYFESIVNDVKWLLKEEFYGEDGDELTPKIRSELNAYINGLESFNGLLQTLDFDECDDSIIIVKNKTEERIVK